MFDAFAVALAALLAPLAGEPRTPPAAAAASGGQAAHSPRPALKARRGPTLPVGRCINLSNTFEAPDEGAWAPKVTDQDLQVISQAGFSTLRLPVRWSAHAQGRPPYALEPEFLRRVRHVVDAATANRLNVILDLHNYDELMSAPSENLPRFVAIWRQVAASFADAPASVWFELLNEPKGRLSNEDLPSILGPALAAVRETNPTRPVIIGGADSSSLDALLTLPLPDDPNVVPTFHYYEPMAFTHQGAPWTPNAPPFGRAYGGRADRARIDRDLKKLSGYLARTGRAPFVGEYGAQDDPRVPPEQRIAYYRAVSSGFASLGVASCVWGYRSGFAIRQGDRWLPGMLEAIASPSPPRD